MVCSDEGLDLTFFAEGEQSCISAVFLVRLPVTGNLDFTETRLNCDALLFVDVTLASSIGRFPRTEVEFLAPSASICLLLSSSLAWGLISVVLVADFVVGIFENREYSGCKVGL